jgi:hypothetical protein
MAYLFGDENQAGRATTSPGGGRFRVPGRLDGIGPPNLHRPGRAAHGDPLRSSPRKALKSSFGDRDRERISSQKEDVDCVGKGIELASSTTGFLVAFTN